MEVTSTFEGTLGNGHQIEIIVEKASDANFTKASVDVGGATITSTEQGTLGNDKKIEIIENNFAQISEDGVQANSRKIGGDGNGNEIIVSVKSTLDGIHEVTKAGDNLNISLGRSILQLQTMQLSEAN